MLNKRLTIIKDVLIELQIDVKVIASYLKDIARDYDQGSYVKYSI